MGIPQCTEKGQELPIRNLLLARGMPAWFLEKWKKTS